MNKIVMDYESVQASVGNQVKWTEGMTIKDYFNAFLALRWKERRIKLFLSATRQCVRSGCKKFKSMVAEMLTNYNMKDGEDAALLYTPLDLTDCSGDEASALLKKYAHNVFDDEKTRKMLEKKGLVPIEVGENGLIGYDAKDKVKKRVNVLYCLLVTKTYAERLSGGSSKIVDDLVKEAWNNKAPAPAKSAAPVKSNAPSLD